MQIIALRPETLSQLQEILSEQDRWQTFLKRKSVHASEYQELIADIVEDPCDATLEKLGRRLPIYEAFADILTAVAHNRIDYGSRVTQKTRAILEPEIVAALHELDQQFEAENKRDIAESEKHGVSHTESAKTAGLKRRIDLADQALFNLRQNTADPIRVAAILGYQLVPAVDPILLQKGDPDNDRLRRELGHKPRAREPLAIEILANQ